jgi:alkanesulfonate monooxygenase SsuD/methylene tetrahydromethanopterin reductase-like flavin-dependent oxidoreductase (luciferase family)
MAKIQFGWHIHAFPVDGASAPAFIDQIARVLEKIEGRFDSAWADDHFIPWATFQSPDTPFLECMTTLAYLAAAFPRLRFGSSVLCQSFRSPGLVAKMGANLQLLTRGRFILGIGAGWLESEYHAYNYDFPSPAVRIRQLEEAVQIIRALWSETPATFTGQYYRIQDAYCVPKPEPMPPILIGGGGEQLTLRVVARHADWWNIPGGSLENYAHKLEVLRAHCQAVGREYNDIVKTWSAEAIALAPTEAEAQRIAAASPYQNHPIVGTPAQVAAQLRPFIDLGVEHLILRLVDFPSTAGIELFMDEVTPRLQMT